MGNEIENSIAEEKKQEYSTEDVLNMLYDKSYVCPCCDNKFTDRTVKSKGLRLLYQDSDLRAYYAPLDPILYGVVICNKCGYTSLARTFDNLTFKQAQTIKTEITPKFKNMTFPKILNEDMAILRYKTALMTAMITRVKSSEIAYLYMRLAWIYRSKGETNLEKKMILASFEGFLEAMQKEYFPLLDLDEETAIYIMGDFLYRLEKPEQAKQFFSKIIRKKDANPKIKARIQEHPCMQRPRT